MATPGDSRVGNGVTAAEIEAAVAAAGLAALPPGVGEKLAAYLQLLLRWNSKLNLTAVREPGEIVRRHLVECVQCAQALPEVGTLLDFGSGAGLPGIPIAIVRPEIRVTLGESQGKKATFLREVVRVLGLNAEVFDGRIEKMPTDRIFDAVTLRAVDRMTEACRAGVDRVGAGGWLVVFATAATEENLKPALTDVIWE
ncbi:MAG TPA: 16S rRNA (guanine(527)-N(7))-methyltransferase RsmG, partial [Silvibacterium sp.]|nr:16S rRNA (guanine(527)-N(7))-methyltransferase RsmG [Silvibacterium sp.]